MLRFFFALLLVVHGSFAVAVQHYFPSRLVGFLAPKKAASLHQLFPVNFYPPDPSGPGGYWLALVEVTAGVLILKSLSRL